LYGENHAPVAERQPGFILFANGWLQLGFLWNLKFEIHSTPLATSPAFCNEKHMGEGIEPVIEKKRRISLCWSVEV
jgi:hypothetical protein